MNNDIGVFDEICNVCLSWTEKQYEAHEETMSAEVYDRAVSVIGIAVPLMLISFALASFVCMLAAVFKGVRR